MDIQRKHRIVMMAVVMILAMGMLAGCGNKSASGDATGNAVEDASGEASIQQKQVVVYTASETDDTRHLTDEIISSQAILVDLDTDEIVAEKGAFDQMYPASMTKVLTVLVAAEQLSEDQLDDTYTFPQEVVEYCFTNGGSTAGFEKDETVTVRDLFYGTILPSGGEAAVGLAYYVAGSQEAFVDLMNEKLDELGLGDTAHMTNCVGIYGDDHYCTPYDMAMVMEAAMANDFAKEVLSAHIYTTSVTEQHPDGLVLSNRFLRRIEDKDILGTVIGAKTGYVSQSGSNAVSYGVDADGHAYVVVTGGAGSGGFCMEDHVTLYNSVMHGETTESGSATESSK